MMHHPFPPLYDSNSKILILGSFPSVKSREQLFFYGHPQNRFWKVLATIFQCDTPQTIEEKTSLLLQHGIALWDVIASCDIKGSADSSILHVTPNDPSPILSAAPIRQIFTNGKTADKYYNRYICKQIGMPAVCLPSTSPANAAYTLPRLVAEWEQIRF